MLTTDKAVCRELAALLVCHGVKDVVLSPGSRNAPLILAVARSGQLRRRVVVDERCAAFVALGMAVQSQRPVALVCTSGTAMLNYAPAVAEAFYREVPLIVITADRPQEWIDQDDSQTIRQYGALDNIVKESYNIPVETGDATQMWMVNRLVSDALLKASSGRKGPVHINVQLDVPLTTLAEAASQQPRMISTVERPTVLPTAQARELGRLLAPPCKVLVVAGFHNPDSKLSRAMARLAAIPNVAVLCEAQANLHSPGLHSNIDRILNEMTDAERTGLLPDIVITLGGSLVSRFIKAWLRGRHGVHHWHVGERGASVDCFKCLSLRIELPAASFMPQLASAMQPFAGSASTYGESWRQLAGRARKRYREFTARSPWCDLKAMDMLVEAIPARANLQAGNGTAVRYIQLCDNGHIHRTDCNRGVSGIDGCTSTAIGASMAYGDLTVLVSGDMSAQYDMGALAISGIPPTFRLAVLDNGGGGIFRFIKSTATLDELDECFAADVRLPLRQLAEGFGFRYLRADGIESMKAALPAFFGHSDRSVILDIVTDGTLSAAELNRYFDEANSK